MKRACLTLSLLAALAVPTADALAAPRMAVPLTAVRSTHAITSAAGGKLAPNEQSDRRMLFAYANYLNALLVQVPTGEANGTSFVSVISSQCKAALTPLTQPPNDVSTAAQRTLRALGREMGDDLSISFDAAAVSAFTRFSQVLLALRWTKANGASAVVRRYVDAENAVLAFPPSNLCLNASDAELTPDVVPDATRAFLRAYDAASHEANQALTDLRSLMQSYEAPQERGLIVRISSLAAQLTGQMKAGLLQSATSLASVLGAN